MASRLVHCSLTVHLGCPTVVNEPNGSISRGGHWRNLIFEGSFLVFGASKHTVMFFPKVVGAKVVTNARSPGARCYGFVTMSTSEEATKCINHLHRTELHGKMISVEKVSGSCSTTAQ